MLGVICFPVFFDVDGRPERRQVLLQRSARRRPDHVRDRRRGGVRSLGSSNIPRYGPVSQAGSSRQSANEDHQRSAVQGPGRSVSFLFLHTVICTGVAYIVKCVRLRYINKRYLLNYLLTFNWDGTWQNGGPEKLSETVPDPLCY